MEGLVRRTHAACVAEVEKLIVGQRAIIDGAFVGLISEGHVLLEGVPGVAKTLLVRAFAAALDVRFSRVQFTPDLMPSDVTGSMILREGDLVWRRGPIFTDVLLGDEINRAPAKTQSALLEAMQERAVTSDGSTMSLGPIFTVFATQNPIDEEGTYPLPAAELDRFMLMLRVGYPDEAAERAILERHHDGAARLERVEKVLDRDALEGLKAEVRAIEVRAPIIDYVTRLTRATREALSVHVGASPRAGLALLKAAKAQAAIEGRSFVTPDDVKRWAAPVFRHRLVLLPGAELSGATADEVVAGLTESVAVPA